MIDERRPVQHDGRHEHVGHQWRHPGEHQVGQDAEALGGGEHVAHAHRGSDEKHRQVVEPFHILALENADAGQQREQADPDPHHGGRDVVEEIGDP